MKIFVSWSGQRSRAVAEVISAWLQRVIQAVEPFYSPDIEKGAKWSGEIDDALEGTRFGIICLTPDNINSTWIHYETGALSKTKDALIWTFLHGLTPGDVPPPLGKFQHTVAEKNDVLKLLRSINTRLGETGGHSLRDGLLEDIFEESWTKLESKLKEIAIQSASEASAKGNKSTEKHRAEKEVLDEILELVRNQQRQLDSFTQDYDRRLNLFSDSPILLGLNTTDKSDSQILKDRFQTLSFTYPHDDNKDEESQALNFIRENISVFFPDAKVSEYQTESGTTFAVRLTKNTPSVKFRRFKMVADEQLKHSINNWKIYD